MPRSFPLSLKKKETLYNGQRMEYSKLISAQVFFVFPPYMSIYIFFSCHMICFRILPVVHNKKPRLPGEL